MRDFKHHQAAPDAPTRWMRLRVSLLGVVFVALLLGLFARAVNLQIHQRDKLAGMAKDQYQRELEIPARRGDIFDRRGTPLAQSVDVDSLWVDPSLLPDPKDAAKRLSKVLGVDQKELVERFMKGKRFVWAKRQVTQTEVQRVQALGLPGLGYAKEPRRFYPQRELAAHVIGLVGTDSHGLDGLELSFEDELSGDEARRASVRDAKGRKVLTHGVEDPLARQGASVTLTIDRHLQYVTEKALLKAVDDARGVAGMAVVLDPKTGEVLALANAPRFNPNAPQGVPADALRNRAVTDAFEPGSTMKAFVVARALDEGLVTPATTFDCEKGRMPIGRHVINDTHPSGVLDVRGVLQVSSNIGAAKVGQRLGRERLVETYQRFGCAERAGLGLPGEAKGVVPFPKAEISLATQSFGQGLTASPLQVTAAFAALGNGGVLMKPYLVSRVVDADGLVLLEHRPTEVRRVVSAKTARVVVELLESVVEKGGTAPRARMDAYRVSGKTGTAQKADPVARGYSDKRFSSFVGLVPAEAPRVVIGVFIDEPKTDVYGGLVAAPAFKEIAEAAMPHLAVPPSREVPAPAVAAAATPSPPPLVPEKSPVVAAIERLEAGAEGHGDEVVRVPNLSGHSGRAAVKEALTASLEPRLVGSGRVVSQSPAAGTLVDKGARITLELAGPLPSTTR
ncbi:MAG: transpeptidase family protein [Myxococcaceae bacterium]|nr:transpeptidase family protein [Myxococcaceae bacterium]